jgi:hypothetical protein
MKVLKFESATDKDMDYRREIKAEIDNADCCIAVFYNIDEDRVYYMRDNLSYTQSIAFLEVVKQKLLNEVVPSENN